MLPTCAAVLLRVTTASLIIAHQRKGSGNIVLLTSAVPGEGKSALVAVNNTPMYGHAAVFEWNLTGDMPAAPGADQPKRSVVKNRPTLPVV